MFDNLVITSKEIESTSEILKSRIDFNQELINFYKNIFMVQEESKKDIDLDPIIIDTEVLKEKKAESKPLVALSDFEIDYKASYSLLKKLIKLIPVDNEVMTKSGKIILDLLDSGNFDFKDISKRLLTADFSYIVEFENKSGIEKGLLPFFIYNSIKPSITICSEQLSSYLKEDEIHKQTVKCPVCGSVPVLSVFHKEGQRTIFCSNCWFNWDVERIFCVYCKNKDAETLSYFFDEDLKEYRVDKCDICNRYIKSIDLRKESKSIYPPLEVIATLHLDIKAKELNLDNGSKSFL